MAFISSGIHAWDHFARGNLTHAVAEWKELSIKFSYIDDFWTSARLVLGILSILSWLSWL